VFCLTGMHLGGGFPLLQPQWTTPMPSHAFPSPRPTPPLPEWLLDVHRGPGRCMGRRGGVLDDRRRLQSSLAASESQYEQVLSSSASFHPAVLRMARAVQSPTPSPFNQHAHAPGAVPLYELWTLERAAKRLRWLQGLHDISTQNI
jgi:hypothetical protein